MGDTVKLTAALLGGAALGQLLLPRARALAADRAQRRALAAQAEEQVAAHAAEGLPPLEERVEELEQRIRGLSTSTCERPTLVYFRSSHRPAPPCPVLAPTPPLHASMPAEGAPQLP
eukprot:COSAG04_NODE_76_length_28498_cov_7.756294_9_plen_117_part_00